MKINKETRVGDIASTYPKTVDIFVNYAIDFCCKGYKSLEITAEEFELNLEDFIEEIKTSIKVQEENKDFDVNVSLDKVIASVTHLDDELMESITQIDFFAKKVATVHGSHTPSLVELQDVTVQLTEAVNEHLEKCKNGIYKDAIKLINGEKIEEKLKSQTTRLQQEHFSFGISLDKITELTNNFTPPDDACNSYKILFSKLEEFKVTVMKHANINNYTVHPKLLELNGEAEEESGGCGCSGNSCS